MKHDPPLADAPARGLTSPGSDPPSGVRRRGVDDAADGALAAFVARGAPAARTIASRFGVSLPDAEDIRQDTLLAMLEMTEAIRSPLALFWTMAELRKRRCLSVTHRPKRYEAEMLMLAQQQRSPLPPPEAALQQRALEDALARVAPCGREVAELRLAGDDETEVAEELGIPVNTVRSRWRRAKDVLRIAVALALALWLRLLERRWPGGDAPAGRRRRGAGALFACVTVALAITTHARILPLSEGTPAIEEASILAPAAGWGAVAPSPAMTPPATRPEREHETGTPSRPPDPVLTTRPNSPPTAAPTRRALSGRSTGAARAPGAISTHASAGDRRTSGEHDTADGPAPAEAARLEAARTHLAAAHRELWMQGDRGRARELLELYEMTFPEDPFPAKHIELASALRAP